MLGSFINILPLIGSVSLQSNTFSMDKASLYKLSRFYNQKRELSQEFWADFFEETGRFLSDGEKRWLDVGCGSGRIVLPLANCFPNSWFLGMDISIDMLSQLGRSASAQKDIKNISILQADMNCPLPIINSLFDCVCLFQTIHYFNMESVYNQLSGFVSEGSFLIIASTTHDQFKELPYCAYTPVLNYEIARTPDSDKIEKDAQTNGFKVMFRKDYAIYQEASSQIHIQNYLRSLPYSAFCILDEDKLEEAIEATLCTINEGTFKAGFMIDSFRLTIFKYVKPERGT